MWLAIALIVGGPALLIVQLRAKQLWTPWYIPVLAGIGAILLSINFRMRPSFARGLGAVIALLWSAWTAFVLGVGIRTPEFHGSVQIGQPIPPFSTTLANGDAFSQSDLAKGSSTLLTFFRGRW